MKLAIFAAIVIALLLAGDILLNDGHGARAVQRNISHAVGSITS